MRYVSLFTGVGAFEYGLHRVCPSAQCHGFSEIDKDAVAIYCSHFPSHQNLGDINNIDFQSLGQEVDLLFGGSPCQDLSSMNHTQEGLTGAKSSLLFKFIEALSVLKPRYFILENTGSMTQENRDRISVMLGVQPVMLDAAWFSAQSRKRLFWCNFPVPEPTTKATVALVDVLDPVVDSPRKHSLTALRWITQPYLKTTRLSAFGQTSSRRHSRTVLATWAKGVPNNVLVDERYSPAVIRPFTVAEVERLQSLPNWTSMVPRTSALRCLGNAVNGEVAFYLFSCLIRGI